MGKEAPDWWCRSPIRAKQTHSPSFILADACVGGQLFHAWGTFLKKKEGSEVVEALETALGQPLPCLPVPSGHWDVWEQIWQDREGESRDPRRQAGHALQGQAPLLPATACYVRLLH